MPSMWYSRLMTNVHCYVDEENNSVTLNICDLEVLQECFEQEAAFDEFGNMYVINKKKPRLGFFN